jgi:hypothetical protein
MNDDAVDIEVGVELTSFPSATEAELTAALLRSCGIEARVAEATRTRPTGGNRVFVRAADLELAREILAAPIVDDDA